MRKRYKVEDMADIETEAYRAGKSMGEVLMRDRIIELIRSEQELASGFSSRNALISDLVDLIREEA